jgi:hypothetical protein
MIPTVSRHGGKLSEVEIDGPHHFTSQMFDQGPLKMGQPRQSDPVSGTMEQYLQQERERLRRSRGRTGTGRETRNFWTAMNQTYSRIQSLNITNMTQTLSLRCAVSILATSGDYFDVLKAQITVPTRGRRPVIGAKDRFFLFIHWLRSANPINQIVAHFDLRSPTLYKHLHKLALAVQNRLVTEYITDLREQPLRVTGPDYRSYGLVVRATVQKRGRPAASFEEAWRYFSGKHWIYCLKSQVVTNRQRLALHVVAGVSGSVHDLALFRSTVTELEELVASKRNEPTKILADKGYIGFTDSQILQLMTP